jgi:predicted nucleotidyltransferase
MKYGIRDDIFDNIIDKISKDKSVQRVLLFGSRARGDNRSNSDIDLAVYADNGISGNLFDAVDEAAGVYKFDLIDMCSSINETLRKRIEEEGVIVFEAKHS